MNFTHVDKMVRLLYDTKIVTEATVYCQELVVSQ